MKKLFLILILLFCSHTDSAIAMTSQETAQAKTQSSLPKILHNIAYSERVGKFCSWLFKPVTRCCKSERVRSWFTSPQATSPELGDHPLVKMTKVKPATSTGFKRFKQAVAIISIGFLVLFTLPQANAFFQNNLQDYLKPTVCVQNDSFKRCCTIEDNMHISCCVTDKILGIEVCKDLLVTMPETASIPFGDLSRIKDQCSADLTPESRMIRQEFDGIMQRIESRKSPSITIPNALDAAPQFAHVIQGYLENLGIPRNAPLCVVFPRSKNTTIFLDAELFKTPIDDRSYYGKRYPAGGLATLHLRSNLFEYLSVDEILAVTGHELGHLLFHLRNTAQKYLFQSKEISDLPGHNEEIFADLVGGLLSTQGHQTAMVKQHLALTDKTSEECAVKNLVDHPPHVCRNAYLDNVQNQLEELS